MQINRFAIAFLTLVSTASAAEVTASKRATRKAQKSHGNATPISTSVDDFDASVRSFHSMVNHSSIMTGYTSLRSNPSLDGSRYDKVASIMKALGNPHPEEFVGIIRDLYWDDEESIDGRRLGIFKTMKSWAICAAHVTVSAGYCATHFKCTGGDGQGGTMNYMDAATSGQGSSTC